jgi:mannose PTS system EIIC component
MEFVLVLFIAFIAGIEGVLDEFEFHQPLVSCTLIGLVTGHLQEGILLGGSLQLIALGWANIGAAVAPDVCLASIISSILMMKGLHMGIDTKYVMAISIMVAIPLSLVGLSLTKICRTLANRLVHKMDETRNIVLYQWSGICMQGLRIVIPAFILMCIPKSIIGYLLNLVPLSIYKGLYIGSGVVCVVGFAIVANVLGSKFTWPFFLLGFGLATFDNICMLALCVIGAGFVWIYMSLQTKPQTNNVSDDPLGDILNDYE